MLGTVAPLLTWLASQISSCTYGLCQVKLARLLQVAFDDLPINANKTCGQRREYWEKSRRLQHGTLVALWWEQPQKGANTPAQPCITFATISMRNEQQLAPREAGERPQIGLR